MLKDFSQPFIPKPTHAHVLIQDVLTQNFISFRHPDDIFDYGEDAVRVFYTQIDPHKEAANQLCAALHAEGFSLISYRELVRETALSYSLADVTPGSRTDTVCYYAVADMVTLPKHATPDSLDIFAKKIQYSEVSDNVTIGGITVLLNEHELLLE